MHAWQKQSKYQPQFLLNFQNWFLKVLYIQQIKNQTLSADFPILQTHLFLHVMIRWVMQTICFDFANTRHVIAGKFSTKPHGTYRCHIWTQYGPYITFLAFLMYLHDMFHLHPPSYIPTFTFTKLRHFRQPITRVAGDVMFYFCIYAYGNKVEALLYERMTFEKCR